MAKVILWGGTGQARVDREILEMGGRNKIVAVIDDFLKTAPVGLDGIPFYKNLMHLLNSYQVPWYKNKMFVISIGNQKDTGGRLRLNVARILKQKGYKTMMVLHPTSSIAKGVRRGDGVKILAYAYVGVNTMLGQQVIINTHASVDHDCVLEDGVEVCPGATVCGEVQICKNATIGAGAVVLPRVRVGKHAFVGAGTTVTKDVNPYTIVFQGSKWTVQEIMEDSDD